MPWSNTAAQQVCAQPASIFAERALPRKLRRASNTAAVFGSDEPGRRLDAAHSLHAQSDAPGLLHKRSCIACMAAMVRIPVCVEASEARRGVGFVHRRIGGRPGITLRD